MSIHRVGLFTPTSVLKKEQPPGLGHPLSCRDRFVSFAQDAAGDVAMLFGLMAMAMFMLIGSAVDFGRWLNARDDTVAAIDAAVLAAGRALQTNGGDEADAIRTAKVYYAQAVKNRLTVKDDQISFVVVDNGTAVEATGNAKINTPFMRLAGINELQLLKATAGEDRSKAVIAVGGNSELNLEISMMLDVSGSMQGQKAVDMKAAASDLVNIIVWKDQSEYTSKVAIVPFSSEVRPPADMLAAITPPVGSSWPLTRQIGNKNYGRTSCVAERHNSNRYTDAVAGPGDYVTPVYNQGGSCDIAQKAIVMPMTNDKAALLSRIADLTTGGMTAGHVGTAWAYYMLSPDWSPLLPALSQPVAYSTPKTEKIAILMTDGEYNSTVGTNGVEGGNGNGSSSSGQAIAICNQMKQDKITVYTVGFDLGNNSTAINTLKNCATDASKAYVADSGEKLRAAFRDIALKVSSLYLTK